MDTKVIFVGGVHGVGKSTFCHKLQSYYQKDIERFSASALIKNYKPDAFTRDKKVGDVGDNQSVLVKAFNEQKKPKRFSLLDGHFCLFNNYYEPQKVHESVFRDLKIQYFILLAAPVNAILERMEQRDESKYPLDKILQLQHLEVSSARAISTSLKKPLLILDHVDITEGFDSSILQIWRMINQ